MTLEEFEDGLDRYGAHLGDWPESLRAQAQALSVSSPAASALLAQASRLDRLFEPRDVPPPPSIQAILAFAIPAPRLTLSERLKRAVGFDLFDFGWVHAGGLAACLIVGFAVGLSSSGPSGVSPMLLDLAFGAHVDQSDE